MDLATVMLGIGTILVVLFIVFWIYEWPKEEEPNFGETNCVPDASMEGRSPKSSLKSACVLARPRRHTTTKSTGQGSML